VKKHKLTEYVSYDKQHVPETEISIWGNVMILGIDVGGTHTDAVIIDDYEIKKTAKVLTNHENLIETFKEVTDTILGDENIDNLDRIVLSTTMSTNAIVQGKVNKVGMILASGPGLAPSMLKINEHTHFLSGYVNHRGIKIAETDFSEVSSISECLTEAGIRHVGIVGKFSTRNPELETNIADMINTDFEHLSFGHRMSGNLNFPRRVATTYLNAAIWDTYGTFVEDVLKFVETIKASIPIYVLKADGGTSDINQSAKYPVGTILSGPAASIMGILSLANFTEDAIALDIGGTTTDIAIFAEGVPLLEPFGVTIEGHKTLTRGLRSKSIGIGGDSKVVYDNGIIVIGPERAGPAAAFGGPYPTPTDAMIILDLTDIGDKQMAEIAVGTIADKMGVSVTEAAQTIFDLSCRKIADVVNEMIDEINNKPVYTIHEILEGKIISPEALFVVGGPAKPMASRLGILLKCTSHIPDHSEVANAIGAALARTTTEITLLADTEKRTMTIVEEGIQEEISPSFTREEGLDICRNKLRERAVKMGANEEDIEMETIEDQTFNMVRGYYTTGKNIRLKAQIKPGLIAGFKKEASA
jgi:N-methylhydantoinase A